MFKYLIYEDIYCQMIPKPEHIDYNNYLFEVVSIRLTHYKISVWGTKCNDICIIMYSRR